MAGGRKIAEAALEAIAEHAGDSTRGVEQAGARASPGDIQVHAYGSWPAGGNQSKAGMWNGKLFYRTVGMVDAKYLLPGCRNIHAHGHGSNAQPARRHLEAQEAIVVGAAVGEALPDDLFDLEKTAIVASRPVAVAQRLVIENDGSALCVINGTGHTMPGGDHGIRADQGHAASRNIKTQVLIEVHMHDHAYRGLDGIADISRGADAAYVFPIRRRGAEPEWIVFRFRVARIALEWITIGKSRGILDAGVPLSPAVLVELNAAGSRAIGDVADGHRTA